MKRLLKYFFYKIYSFSLSNGQKDAGWAMTIVALFVLANLYSIFDIILILTKTKLPELGNFVVMAVCGLILFSVYALLMKNDKAEIIVTITLFIYTGSVVRSLNA